MTRFVTWPLQLIAAASFCLTTDHCPLAAEPPGESAPISEEAAEAKILAALEKPIDLQVVEKPLREVVDELSQKLKIGIFIDEKSLKDVGIDSNSPVTKSLKGVRARSVLRLMLKEMDLTWIIRDDSLTITTSVDADFHHIERIYPVEDLVGKKDSAGLSDRIDNLIDMITGTISTGWDDNPGSVSGFGTSLLVEMSRENQEHVANLLALLRKSRASFEKWDGKTRPIPGMPPDLGWHEESPFDAAWRAARRRPITLGFVETPLNEVVDAIKQRSGIEIQIDDKALKDVGIDSKSPITFKCHDLPLESALRQLLRPHELTFVHRDDVVLITTPEEANAKLVTWVFPIYDLIGDEEASETFDLVTGTRAANGVQSPGSSLYIPAAGALVVQQTHEKVREIAATLARLREVTPVAPKRDPLKADHQIVLRVYSPFQGIQGPAKATPEEIRRAIVALIEPESWDKKDGPAKILIVGDRLVVRHEAKIHEQIDRLIDSLVGPRIRVNKDPVIPVPQRKTRYICAE